MTSQSPRIYIYKITFEEVLYYYYGVKKERYFNQEYWGSPVTNKWCWELYTPKKQILEVFDYTDEGWIEAQEVESRIIKPVYNIDKWCLNENCGGKISLTILRNVGRISGKKSYEEGTGMFSLTPEQKSENGKKLYEKKLGIHSLTHEQRVEFGKKSYAEGKGIAKITTEERRRIAIKNYEEGRGWFSLTSEERSEICRKNHNEGKGGLSSVTKEQMIENGKNSYEQGLGIHALTFEQRSENSKKNNSQRWMCTETGFITSSGPLTNYQRKRDIDTSKRIRLS
jgi:hypothetical protein